MSRTPTNRDRLTRGTLILSAILALAFPAGAAPKKGRNSKAKDQPAPVELAWPEPPLTPRIKVVNILASEADLGRKMTFGESLNKFLTGQKPTIAHIYQPRAIAVSDDGKRVYASDFGESAIFIFDFDTRKVRTFRSERPFGIALDEQENIYVAEEEAKRIVVFDRAGNKIRSMVHEKLARPTGVAIDRARKRLYVADPATKAAPEHTVKIFDLGGKFLGTVGKGKGGCPGCLFFPTYVAVDKAGSVYVSSTMNARVDVFDPGGNYLRSIGTRGTNFGMFDKPKGVAVDSFGNVHVVDSGWSNVQIFNQKGEVLLFYGGRGDYPGLMRNPTGIAIDKENKIYVADYLNYRISVYQLVNTKAEDSFVTLPSSNDKGGEATGNQKREVNTGVRAGANYSNSKGDQ
jgi:DNA-binding beta-propeller fold protein YncE